MRLVGADQRREVTAQRGVRVLRGDDEVEGGPLPGERLGGHRDVRVDVGPGGAVSAAPAGGVALRRTPGEAGHQAGRGPGEHRAAGRTGPTGKGGAGGHGADSSVPDVR